MKTALEITPGHLCYNFDSTILDSFSTHILRVTTTQCILIAGCVLYTQSEIRDSREKPNVYLPAYQ
jgi:hypothetical protein